ncbi:4678_t:CDS:1, partial [Dentiscutata heterogama]
VAEKLTVGKITLYSIFRLFFSDLQLSEIVKNTNLNIAVKSTDKEHKWITLTIKELLIWLGLIIYIGVFKLQSRKDYW